VEASAQLVREFCEAFTRRDIDEILAYFTDDAVYHNIPMTPATATVVRPTATCPNLSWL
jgi:ketosteroid isomerase-like protein